jgi:Ser/Thr protein kinase RdoA (MazF antagonist)
MGGMILSVARLPHGYTNRTRRLRGGVVEKLYDGPRRFDNARRELACLHTLAPHLPVPAVVDADLSIPRLALDDVSGTHGQDLIDQGHASWVLDLVGTTLTVLQSLPPDTVRGLAGTGPVLVHGDFGPQNMLFDVDAHTVTGILDWESAHVGARVEDLAWAEWIVRMHHAETVDAVDVLLAAANDRSSWGERHAAMVRQCEEILDYCNSAGMEDAAAAWQDRLRCTRAWTDQKH